MPLFEIPKRVGFTGTQEGMTKYQRISVRKILKSLKDDGYTWFHHGDCIGSDAQAACIAKVLGYKIHCHPPMDDKARAFVPYDACEDVLPYLARNKKIVEAVSFMIATPKTHHRELRSGTWSTVRHTERLNKDKEIVYPSLSA